MPQPIPFQPNSYTKRILLSVIGLTPQAITETIYALSQQNDTFIPTELHVITTKEGYDRTREFTELETKLMKQDGIDKEWFDELISRIKKAFVNAFGVKGAAPYLPTTAGRNQPRMLTLPKTAITIVKE